MKKFKELVNGKYFKLNIDSRPQFLEFFTTRFVEAKNMTKAEEKAPDLIKMEFKDVTVDRPPDETLHIDEIDELDSFPDDVSIPEEGVTFYPGEDDIRIQIIKADITEFELDAIVNAAKPTLLGGSGVDGAIHAAAGPGLLQECRRLAGCPTGDARITGGYDLPAKYVIHTVGPVWKGGDRGEDEMLARCYRSVLSLSVKKGIKTIAFPSISTGAYVFPVKRASKIAVAEIRKFLEADNSIRKVIIACFTQNVFDAYTGALK